MMGKIIIVIIVYMGFVDKNCLKIIVFIVFFMVFKS